MTQQPQPVFRDLSHAVPARPDRQALLHQMLEGTHRGGVPIRRQFLRSDTKDAKGTRAGMLSKLVRDENALNAFLLIHSVASSSAPYDALYPAATWVQVSGLDRTASPEAAKTRWAKVSSKLVTLKLIARERDRNQMKYMLLHESGTGDAYTRPRVAAHGNWFSIPHVYWFEDFDLELTLPEKVMLLILLDQLDDFRMPTDLAPQWYGISEATARKGFRGLENRGIITRRVEKEPDSKSPTGWKQVLYYTTVGPWSIAERQAAMHASGAARAVKFKSVEKEDT